MFSRNSGQPLQRCFPCIIVVEETADVAVIPQSRDCLVDIGDGVKHYGVASRYQSESECREIINESKGAFIRNFIFQKPFKVYTIDENTRVFIDKLSSFNSLFRTLGVSYDTVVKTLRENFTEKKAMSALYKLEKLTIELVKVNSEIVALAQKFDEQWSLKSR